MKTLAHTHMQASNALITLAPRWTELNLDRTYALTKCSFLPFHSLLSPHQYYHLYLISSVNLCTS